MRAIYEIAREITILNSIGYKTNNLLLWRYPIKRISVTGQQNGSADRTVKHYRLATFNVKVRKVQNAYDLCLLFHVTSNVS